MSNKTTTLFQLKRILPHIAFSTRVALHFSVLFVVATFPCAIPNIWLHELTESEAPVGEDEPSEESTASTQDRKRSGRNHPGFPLLAPVDCGLSLQSAGTISTQQSGHRLPNNLMAPLRC